MADVYTSGSGNWISPGNGVVLAKGNGGGGGGGGGNNAGGGTAGSGGGGGGYFEVEIAVTTGQSIAYVVGAGGAGGTQGNPGTNGTAGGTTTVDGGTYTANGGAAGQTASTGTPAGGIASGGDTNTSGSAGGGATATTTGGTGGASPNGGATKPGTIPNEDVEAGNAPGGGGPGGAGGVNGTDGGAGAAGEVSFDFTADPLIESEILRPIAGLEEYSANTTWQDIDDVVTQPTIPGDVVYLGYDSAVAATFVEKWKVQAPTPGYTILGATLWMLIWLPITALPSRYVYSVRIKLNGTWYDLGAVNRALGVGPAWYSFELTGISESSDSDDIGFEVTLTFTGGSSQSIQIDAAYLELTYPSLEQSSGFLMWF